MNEKVNYHTHCKRCKHASGAERDYVNEALRLGLTRLGMTDHIPFEGDKLGLRMDFSELGDYLEELTRLKEEFAGRIKLYRGFEAEYLEDKSDYYESLLNRGSCDYLILGQHFFNAGGGEIINVYNITGTELYEKYAADSVKAMKTGYFRFFAHPDIIFLNSFAWDVHCDRACEIIIDGAVKYGFALEYNANGLRRPKRVYPDGERFQYPHDRFWQMVAGTGVKTYVGSDCHEPEILYDSAVIESYGNLRKIGIEPEVELFEGK